LTCWEQKLQRTHNKTTVHVTSCEW